MTLSSYVKSYFRTYNENCRSYSLGAQLKPKLESTNHELTAAIAPYYSFDDFCGQLDPMLGMTDHELTSLMSPVLSFVNDSGLADESFLQLLGEEQPLVETKGESSNIVPSLELIQMDHSYCVREKPKESHNVVTKIIPPKTIPSISKATRKSPKRSHHSEEDVPSRQTSPTASTVVKREDLTDLKIHHNETERNRRLELNASFRRLQKDIPALANRPNTSKRTILNAAGCHILRERSREAAFMKQVNDLQRKVLVLKKKLAS